MIVCSLNIIWKKNTILLLVSFYKKGELEEEILNVTVLSHASVVIICFYPLISCIVVSLYV